MNYNNTLTDYEMIGFGAKANLSDGHAYQNLSVSQQRIVSRLSEIWQESEQQTIPDSEQHYLERFARLIASPGLLSVAGYSMLPTASNSIDLVGAYLKSKGSRVLLTHPTFDNLALLLRRRGVEPQPISEVEIQDKNFREIRLAEADVLFLVNPNNPTGTNLTKKEFSEVVQSCVQLGVTIIIDASFRLFYMQTWDSYQVLQDADASYIVFEDTGKVFPSQDMKVSILAYSADCRDALRELYNEVYLCVSKFSVAVLGEFFEDALDCGLDSSVHKLVASRRAQLRAALGEAIVEPVAKSSQISVEWLSLAPTGLSDTEVVGDLFNCGVGVLPGRGFFWNQSGEPPFTQNFRVSLMKPQLEFDQGVEILKAYFSKVL